MTISLPKKEIKDHIMINKLKVAKVITCRAIPTKPLYRSHAVEQYTIDCEYLAYF